MLLGTPSETLTLSMVTADGRTDLFGRVRVYGSTGTLLDTIDLTHVAEGLYTGAYTPSAEGYYSLVYELFFDAGYTVSAGYEKHGETLDVNGFRTNILRILGLVHENSCVDMQNYDQEQNLTFARVRVYDSTANASAAAAASPGAYNTGLRFQYEVRASYTNGLLSNYNMLRIV